MSSEFENSIYHLRQIGMQQRDQPHHEGLCRASVLVPLFCRGTGTNDVYVLLTQRPMKLRLHAGEVCFPGGKQDPEDKNDDIETALREAKEEVGIDSVHIEPICRLPSLESYTGLCVTPIVGLIDPPGAAEPSSLKISKDEVEAAFVVPLQYFLDDDNLSLPVHEIEWRGGTFEMRTYLYDSECGRQFKIWGLTAYIAHAVAQIAAGSGPIIYCNG